ncbi:NEK protein kinase, variant 1 [Aphanomyces invadans]|nr:NEK protein kinase, variant 1 [Aphanomyces invadans]ETW04769.1 NEK protein kinase, variant 1 [Aphanomyces invadans]|eukprot:XP_008866207.1 NEK protein kinase, variant 1 [Aphanomyces invadans]
MEFCDGKDLAEWLYDHHHHDGGDEAVVLPIFVQIAMALHHMHSCHVLHRDLKPKNVFVFENGRVVVGDFGISKCLDLSNGLAQTLVGSPAYMCPEIFEGKPYDFKADIWALGCILYELLTGRCPFKASSYPALVTRITSGAYAALPQTIRPALGRLVSAMLSQCPDDRPAIQEILHFPGLHRYVEHYVERGHEYFTVASHAEIAKAALRAHHNVLVRPSESDSISTTDTDVKLLVKSKKIMTTDSNMDAKAIVQLRALQAALRYKEKPGVKTAMDLPRYDIRLQQFDPKVAPRSSFQLPPPPPLTQPLNSRPSMKLVSDDSPPKLYRHRLTTPRGVPPPPPPVVGIIRPPPLSMHGLARNNRPKEASLEIVGTQVKSAPTFQLQRV